MHWSLEWRIFDKGEYMCQKAVHKTGHEQQLSVDVQMFKWFDMYYLVEK